MEVDWATYTPLVGVLLAFLWVTKTDKRMACLPSPKSTLPLLGNSLDLAVFHQHKLYDWLYEETLCHGGRPWLLKVLGQPPIVVLSSAKAFEDVMKTQFHIFTKGEKLRHLLGDLLGHGIVASDGEQWKIQRKVLTNLFTMRAFRETITDSIVKHVRIMGRLLTKHRESGKPLDFGLTCCRFTFDTFARIGFGLERDSLSEENDGDINDALDVTMRGINERLIQPLWKIQKWLGIGAQGDLMKHLGTLDKVVYDIVNECVRHRNEATENGVESSTRKVNDVVSLFLDQYAHGTTVDKVLDIDSAFLRDIGVNMLLAGRDTTAATMIWTNLMLNKHPDKAVLVREELHSVLPRLFSDSEYVPSIDDVDQLVYLEAFIRETLRLYPIIPLNLREANSDTVLSDGTFIAKGTTVYFPSYVLGRMKSVWGADALAFKPERWLDVDATTGKTSLRLASAFKFPAFHGGPRICIGMRFAILELKTTLAYVLSKFDLRTVDNPASFGYTISLTLFLDKPMMVNVLPVAAPCAS